jgi:hypothetical protein
VPSAVRHITIDCADAYNLALFWADALGGSLAPDDNPGDPQALVSTPDGRVTLLLQRVPESKTVKNRVHLDLVLPSYGSLISGGARVLDDHQTASFRWTVLADPEGNELCVFPTGQDAPSALVVDSHDPVADTAWWADVLGARPAEAPDGTRRWLADVPGLPWDVWKFVGVEDEKTVKNRWHWDVVSDDVEELVRRGATVLRGPDDVIDWHVLADPAGNEFCVFGP